MAYYKFCPIIIPAEYTTKHIFFINNFLILQFFTKKSQIKLYMIVYINKNKYFTYKQTSILKTVPWPMENPSTCVY